MRIDLWHVMLSHLKRGCDRKKPSYWNHREAWKTKRGNPSVEEEYKKNYDCSKTE
jgi:hypothetical protein